MSTETVVELSSIMVIFKRSSKTSADPGSIPASSSPRDGVTSQSQATGIVDAAPTSSLHDISSNAGRSRHKARPADWPPVNTEIVIVLPKDGGVYRARVSEHDKLNGHILLSSPTTSVNIEASPGDPAMATWTSQAGLHELRTEIIASANSVAPLKVEPTSAVVVHERRRFPRVKRPGGISIEAGSHALSATMLDLSEGGARCVIDTSTSIPPDMVQTTLDLDEQSVKIKGWVAWKKLHGQHTEIGVSFTGVSSRDAELIRRYVLSLQRKQQV